MDSFPARVRAYARIKYGDPEHRLSDEEIRAIVIRRKRERADETKVRDLRRGAGLRRWKEVRFCRAYLGKVAAFLKANGRAPTKREAIVVAGAAMLESGYKVLKPTPGQMLGLPRIQAALYDELERAGLSMAESASIIVDVAKSDASQPVFDKDGNLCGQRVDPGILGAKLNAVGLAFKLTTGFAVAKTASLQMTGNADKMFAAGKDKFAAPPPMGEEEPA